MAKLQKPTSAEKAAHVAGKYSRQNALIAGLFLVGVAILTWWLSKPNRTKKESVQEVKDQRVDSGSINNYNANRDIKIENNTYNGVSSKNDSLNKPDTITKYILKPISNQKMNIHEQTNVTSNNQSGGQTAKEITNNNN